MIFTLIFTFDDGYGNAGKETIVFDAMNAIFNITFTTTSTDRAWSIKTSGILAR